MWPNELPFHNSIHAFFADWGCSFFPALTAGIMKKKVQIHFRILFLCDFWSSRQSIVENCMNADNQKMVPKYLSYNF